MISLSHWTRQHVEALTSDTATTAPVITDGEVGLIAGGYGFWDAWPVQKLNGHLFKLNGDTEIWFALGTPFFDNPDDRHSHARIHLISRTDGAWQHIGPALPDGFAPGSREWSGSAVIDDACESVTLFFTAARRRGEVETSFEQRLFSAEATLSGNDGVPSLVDWRDLREVVERNPAYYMTTAGGTGQVGTIKAFRDPAFFQDPIDGQRYLFFAGSDANSHSNYNGVIGVARASGDSWEILPPIVSADGLNNELERPHVVYHNRLYYLFWVTQRHVFDPEGPTGPTGLYGMVTDDLMRDWVPLNGSGLVLANPDDAPAQAYSWFVFPDLSVTSFVDNWGNGSTRRFGGTFAPFLHLRLDNERASVRS